jgi:DNA-binding response OmpR family regulator
MARPRLLFIDNDRDVIAELTTLLTAQGFHVESCDDAARSLDRIANECFDLILLELVLPRQNGLQICQAIRQRNLVTPVVILTGRQEVKYKVRALECGADDYITKPFEPRELVARLKRLVRRSQDAILTPRSYRGHTLSVDFLEAHVRRGGQTIKLTEREIRILRYLIYQRGAVVSRSQLLTEIWGYSSAALSRTVDTHIALLRQKVETDPHHPRVILTVHGSGYRFND